MRKATTAVLLTFVVFTAGYAVGKEVGVRNALDHMEPSSGSEPSAAAPERQLIVRYYHSTKRCSTCNRIEALSKKVLETHFADQLASGVLVWETANMDDAWNLSAVAEYGLIRSSLVLSEQHEGVEEDYRVLNKLWDLVSDEAAFVAHVTEAVQLVIDGWDSEPDGEDE